MAVFAQVEEVAKKHPVWIVGGGIAVALVLYLLYSQSSGTASATATDGSGLTAQQESDNTSLEEAQLSTQGQLAAQSSQQGYQLATTQDQDSTAVAINTSNNATAVTENNNATAVDQSGIAAQLAGLENNNLTSQNIAQIAANEQISITGENDSTQLGLAQTEAQSSYANLTAQIYGNDFTTLTDAESSNFIASLAAGVQNTATRASASVAKGAQGAGIAQSIIGAVSPNAALGSVAGAAGGSGGIGSLLGGLL